MRVSYSVINVYSGFINKCFASSLPPEEEERKKRSIPQKFIIDLYARIIKLTRVATSKEQRRVSFMTSTVVRPLTFVLAIGRSGS